LSLFVSSTQVKLLIPSSKSDADIVNQFSNEATVGIHFTIAEMGQKQLKKTPS